MSFKSPIGDQQYIKSSYVVNLSVYIYTNMSIFYAVYYIFYCFLFWLITMYKIYFKNKFHMHRFTIFLKNINLWSLWKLHMSFFVLNIMHSQ